MKLSSHVAAVLSLVLLTLPVPADADGLAEEELAALRAEALVRIPMARAIENACAAVSGAKAIRARLALEDDAPVYLVTVLAGETQKVAHVDGSSGKVLRVSEEQPRAVLWHFDRGRQEVVPRGWRIAQTNPTTAMATWEVKTDPSTASKWNVLALARTANFGATYNLAIAEKTSFRDLDLAVEVKAVSGKEDQGGGPIWRCTDENNYYICRFNPLESNFRVYVVKNGKRTELQGAAIHTNPGEWHTVRVTMIGNHIRCHMDGVKMLDVRDDTFGKSGMVGLWTKADAATSFDDLAVMRLDGGGN